ncbi:MAG: DeoR/GlpR transcriptional regulator [Clostridia bacterium]|nr:DeoR/GlpR transcriptional regulator [Clostridia bacterium]
MSKNSRIEDILRLVNSKGSISIGELAEMTFASRSTIRRDIEKLESQGLIRRYHGGAESVLALNPPQIVRRHRNRAEKSLIAEKAAALVNPGSTIFIDASTTVQYMISHLAAIKKITVYTNGADAAIRLSEANIRSICTGGELLAESMAYVGSIAADTVKKVYFDAMFFSSAGFDSEVISDWSEEETVFRRIVMKQSAKKYFLADSSKQNKRYTHIVCHINEIDEKII